MILLNFELFSGQYTGGTPISLLTLMLLISCSLLIAIFFVVNQTLYWCTAGSLILLDCVFVYQVHRHYAWSHPVGLSFHAVILLSLIGYVFPLCVSHENHWATFLRPASIVDE